jgi:ABC-type Fe3+ transport system permease subunit
MDHQPGRRRDDIARARREVQARIEERAAAQQRQVSDLGRTVRHTFRNALIATVVIIAVGVAVAIALTR